MTRFFIQFQRNQPDFSDAVADPTLYHSLDEALEAFSEAGGHRRLYAYSGPNRTALVLKQV